MLKNTIYLLIFNFMFGNGFQMKTYKNNIFDRSVLFYPNIINKQLPSDLYSNFISNIQEKEINVLISQDDISNQKYLRTKKNITNECIVAHSFASKNAIDFFEKNNEIDKMILIDPLDYNQIKLPKFKMPEIPKMPSFIPNFSEIKSDKSVTIENLDSKINEIFNSNTSDEEMESEEEFIPINKKVLVIKTKESSKWSFFPFVPPISILELDIDKLPYKNINTVDVDEYGHFDIMDETWSKLGSKISKGTISRDYKYLNKYHEKLAATLNTFLNHE